MQKKDLHLAKRLEELTDKYEIDVGLWKKKPIEM